MFKNANLFILPKLLYLVRPPCWLHPLRPTCRYCILW